MAVLESLVLFFLSVAKTSFFFGSICLTIKWPNNADVVVVVDDDDDDCGDYIQLSSQTNHRSMMFWH